MANQTVYPYGTDGSLPASVGIINDLTTGGADKALSAEMGKVLNEGMTVGGIVDGPIHPPIIRVPWTINNSDKVVTAAGYNTSYIDVSNYRGKTVSVIKDNDNYGDGTYRFLSELPSVGDTVSGDILTGSTIIPETASVIMTYFRSPANIYTPYDVTIEDSDGNYNQRISNSSLIEQGSISNTGVNASVNNAIRTPTDYARVITAYERQNGYHFFDKNNLGYKVKADFYKFGSAINTATFITGSDTDFRILSEGISPSEIPSDASIVRFVFIKRVNDVSVPITPSILETDEIYEVIGKQVDGSVSIKNAVNTLITEYESLKGAVDGIQSGDHHKITCVQWNIGHFSLGVSKNSTITGESFATKLAAFRQLINAANADLFAASEFSVIFGKDSDNNSHEANDVLFQNYRTRYIGSQYNYSCDALFANLAIDNIKANTFLCNQTAEITHTSAIRATDYYYLSGDLSLGNKTVKIVSTHLAFDANNPQVAQDQIQELVALYSDDEYVIMLGDWNTEDFSLFESAGYTQSNGEDGYLGSLPTFPSKGTALDNIVCKGVYLSNIRVITTELSDHYAIACDITI